MDRSGDDPASTDSGGLVAVAYFADNSITALAGQKTLADIGIRFFTDIRISEALAWAVGGSGVWYGYAQRRLRIKTSKRLGTQNRELEKRLDPKRSSSRYEGG